MFFDPNICIKSWPQFHAFSSYQFNSFAVFQFFSLSVLRFPFLEFDTLGSMSLYFTDFAQGGDTANRGPGGQRPQGAPYQKPKSLPIWSTIFHSSHYAIKTSLA